MFRNSNILNAILVYIHKLNVDAGLIELLNMTIHNLKHQMLLEKVLNTHSFSFPLLSLLTEDARKSCHLVHMEIFLHLSVLIYGGKPFGQKQSNFEGLLFR